VKHIKTFEIFKSDINEAKFFDPSSIEAIDSYIKEENMEAIQFNGFTYQYRYNGVEADITFLRKGETEMDQDYDFSQTVAEYFGPQIRKARNWDVDGEYNMKKFSKWPEIKLLGPDGEPITANTSIDTEIGSDS